MLWRICQDIVVSVSHHSSSEKCFLVNICEMQYDASIRGPLSQKLPPASKVDFGPFRNCGRCDGDRSAHSSVAAFCTITHLFRAGVQQRAVKWTECVRAHIRRPAAFGPPLDLRSRSAAPQADSARYTAFDGSHRNVMFLPRAPSIEASACGRRSRSSLAVNEARDHR
jgi:hypothetical protein